MAVELIGDWTKEKLNRHIHAAISSTPATLPPSLEGTEVHASDSLRVSGSIDLSPEAVDQLKAYLGL
jgi:hypothetical protein